MSDVINPIIEEKILFGTINSVSPHENLFISFQNDSGYACTTNDADIVIREIKSFLNHITPIATIITKYLCTVPLKRELVCIFDTNVDYRLKNMINFVCSDQEIFILCQDGNVYVFAINNKQYVREFKLETNKIIDPNNSPYR